MSRPKYTQGQISRAILEQVCSGEPWRMPLDRLDPPAGELAKTPELPSDIVLELHRSIGWDEFFGVVGWRLSREKVVSVSNSEWNAKGLWEFCLRWQVPIDYEIELKYIGPDGEERRGEFSQNWPESGYQLYLEPRKRWPASNTLARPLPKGTKNRTAKGAK